MNLAERLVDLLLAVGRSPSVDMNPREGQLLGCVINWRDSAPEGDPALVGIDVQVVGVSWRKGLQVSMATFDRGASVLSGCVSTVFEAPVSCSAVPPGPYLYNVASGNRGHAVALSERALRSSSQSRI